MPAAGLGLAVVQAVDQGPDRRFALACQGALGVEPDRPGRMVERRDPVVQCGCLTRRRGTDTIRSGVRQAVEPAGWGTGDLPGVACPVDQPEAGSVGRCGKGQRMEVRDGSLRDHHGLARDGEGSAGLAQLDADNRLPSPVGNEEGSTITSGQAVLVIANALGSGLEGLAAHQRQGAEGSGQELVGISVMAAADVMRQPARPAMARVAAAQGEDLAGRIEHERARLPLARRDDLEPRAVGPDADHPPARKGDAPPICSGRPVYPPVTHRDVKIAVHAGTNARRDMVVDSCAGEGRGTQACGQLDSLVGPAVSVGIAEGRELWRMKYVKRAAHPFQAADHAQPVDEDRALAVLDGQNRTAAAARLGACCRSGLAEVDRAVGSHGDGRGIANLGGLGRQLDRPAGRRLRSAFPPWLPCLAANDL